MSVYSASRYDLIRTSTTILLIDDDLGDCELTRRALKAAGPDVILNRVANGEEALQYLTSNNGEECVRPDIILLDINMPKLDGRGFMREMRLVDSLKSIPVVALTTSSDVKDIQEMYDLGVNSYITKPSAIGQFKDILSSFLTYWFETSSLPRTC